MLVVLCGWVIFASDTFSQALGFFRAMAGFNYGLEAVYSLEMYLTLDVKIALIAGLVFSMPVIPLLIRWKNRFLASQDGPEGTAIKMAYNTFQLIGLFTIFALCSMCLAAGTHNPLIYFRF